MKKTLKNFESIEHKYNFAIIDSERSADFCTLLLRFNSTNGINGFVEDRPFLKEIDTCKVLDELTRILKVRIY